MLLSFAQSHLIITLTLSSNFFFSFVGRVFILIVKDSLLTIKIKFDGNHMGKLEVSELAQYRL